MIDIHPLFPAAACVSIPDGPVIPFYNVIDYCKTLDYNLNLGKNWASNDTDVLSNPVFKDIKELVSGAIDHYTKNVMMWNSNEFYITQSWINVTPKNTEHHTHYHLNSIISGTFYLQTVPNDHIIFKNDKKPMMSLEQSDFNIWNSDTWKLPVSDNAVVLFPSTIFHCVESHDSDIDRISIAFNVFFRGEIGKKERLTYLKL